MPGSWNSSAHTALSSGAREFVPTFKGQSQASTSLSFGANPFAPGGPGASTSFPSSQGNVPPANAPASASAAPTSWAMRARLSTKASEFVPKGAANTPPWVPAGSGPGMQQMAVVQVPVMVAPAPSNVMVAPAPSNVMVAPAPSNFVFDPNVHEFQPSKFIQPCGSQGGSFPSSQSGVFAPLSKPFNPDALEFTPSALSGNASGMASLNLGAFSDDESEEEQQRGAAPSNTWSASARADIQAAKSHERSCDATYTEGNDAAKQAEDERHEPPIVAAIDKIANGGVEESFVNAHAERTSRDESRSSEEAEVDAERSPSVSHCGTSVEEKSCSKQPAWAWRRNATNRQKDNFEENGAADESRYPSLSGLLPRKVSSSQGFAKPWLKKASDKDTTDIDKDASKVLASEPNSYEKQFEENTFEETQFEEEQEDSSTATTGTGMDEGSVATLGMASEEAALMDGGVDGDDKPMSARELLLWHAAVVAEDLKDESFHYMALAPEVLFDQSDGIAQSPHGGNSGGNWRDDAVKAQKSSGSLGSKDDRRQRKNSEHSQKTPKNLAVSPTSWVAQQQEVRQARKSQQADGKSDTDIVREMKLILNKLTIEKFGALYQQLISCGISTPLHVEILMREVFEKATTQHHFIGMYADLCTQLHKWFIETSSSRDGESGDDGKVFKRILLNQCQVSFEQYLRPQPDEAKNGDAKDDSAESQEMAMRRKNCMLGNLRFVGALLEKGMLASKILIAVVEELLADPTPVPLECCCVFLTAVGPSFDRPDWALHVQLRAAFQKVSALTKDKAVPSRVRFLLQDVLDLRASQWKNKKKAVRSGDGPMTLEAIQRQAEEELGERIQAPPRGNVGTSRHATAPQCTQVERKKLLPRTDSSPKAQPVSVAAFSRERFREEVGETLQELGKTRHVDVAVEKIRAAGVPADKQGIELADFLSRICEQASSDTRQVCFDLVIQLFLMPNGWKKTGLVIGLTHFFGEIYTELKIDLPILPDVVRNELAPALQRLVDAGLLRQTVCSELLTVA